MRYVDFYRTTATGQETAGRVVLASDIITYKGISPKLQKHLNSGVRDCRGDYKTPQDGLAFLAALRYEFTGSYFRASEVKKLIVEPLRPASLKSASGNREPAKLAAALKKLLRNHRAEEFKSWEDPAVNVLDCVLSLNRKYDAFVVPRLDQYCILHQEWVGLTGLRRGIRSYRTPLAFSIRELNYNDKNRAQTLLGVTEYLLSASKHCKGRTEPARLRMWARTARPEDWKSIGVRGFGLAGLQYLRMLFGAQTVKPDRHIVKFVADSIGRPVSAIESLSLLEKASQQFKISIRDIDYVIWEAAARKPSGSAA